jgi:methionyl-tRNA synthetase
MEHRERLSPACRALDGHQIRSRSRRDRARTGVNLARLAAVLAWSIIPTLAETVLHAFGDGGPVPRWPSAPCGPLLDGGAGKPVLRLELLVAKITPERAGDLVARFGG